MRRQIRRSPQPSCKLPLKGLYAMRKAGRTRSAHVRPVVVRLQPTGGTISAAGRGIDALRSSGPRQNGSTNRVDRSGRSTKFQAIKGHDAIRLLVDVAAMPLADPIPAGGRCVEDIEPRHRDVV